MKKSIKEMELELENIKCRREYLYHHYISGKLDQKGFHLIFHSSSIPDDILNEFDFLRRRIENLYININQEKLKQFGKVIS